MEQIKKLLYVKRTRMDKLYISTEVLPKKRADG